MNANLELTTTITGLASSLCLVVTGSTGDRVNGYGGQVTMIDSACVENADGIKVPVRESWLIRAKRDAVYSIISDFEAMPRNFPKVAHSIRILERDGNRLIIEAEAASFGRFFPRARVSMTADLLPGEGYRCRTRGITFNTSGEEELLLVDDPEGTRIQYTYIVTVKNKRFAPLYAWLVRKFALPFWKQAVIDQLEVLLGISKG